MTIDIQKKNISEWIYKTIIRTCVDGFWITDLQGNFLDVNDSYCQLIGYNRNELLTMNIADVEALEKPEDVKQHLEKIIKTGGDRFETRHRCKNGQMVDVEVSVNYVNEEGGLLFVLFRDISERKKAEEALNRKIHELYSFINNIPDMAWLKDKDSRFIIANKAFGDAVGIDPQKLAGNTCAVCFGEEAAAHHRQDDLQVMDGRKQVIIEEKILDKDKHEVWLETIKSPIIDEKEQIIGTVGIARNITIRKRSEQELQNTKNDLLAKIEELKKINELMIGRELKMAQMKKEIDELKKKFGEG